MKKSTIALIVAAVVCLGLSAFSAKASVTRTNEAIEENWRGYLLRRLQGKD